jgi:hypothetical protein
VDYAAIGKTVAQSHMRKEPVMAKSIRYVGLDVHADTIAVAIAEGRGEARSLGTIPNRPEPIRKLIKRLEPVSTLKVCYEAGPTGYALYWQLVGLGVKCEVVAPTLVPVKAGDRVKTDRRDSEKLARSYRSGDLTLCANVTETARPPEISVEGEQGIHDDQHSSSGPEAWGRRGGSDSPTAPVRRGVQA